jgi:biofilm PGA synthesis N-glycosyltransferase PgaC
MSSVVTDYAPSPDGGHEEDSAAGSEATTVARGDVLTEDSVLDHPVLDRPAEAEPSTLVFERIEPVTAVLDISEIWRAEDEAPADQPSRIGRVVVLIPAHNEAESIGQTLRSLSLQSRAPDEIIVVCDNCTDDTADVSLANGARVMATVGNKARKGGALNQALGRILPRACRDDLILAMDADSQLSKDWIESAVAVLEPHPKLGAVCGTFLGEAGCGLIGQLQRNEYFRYARQVSRRKQALVLSGTGTIFRVRALREVARERGRSLPGKPGDIYNTQTITEDNEITLALKTIGFSCWSALGCFTLTEVMPTWHHLFRQRVRWQRGTLSDLRRYGLTVVTAGYWAKQTALYLAFLVTAASWLLLVSSVHHHFSLNVPWTAAIVGITLVDRITTARRAGWRGILLAILLVPEFAYDLFRLSFFARAMYLSVLHRDVIWNHVVKSDA